MAPHIVNIVYNVECSRRLTYFIHNYINKYNFIFVSCDREPARCTQEREKSRERGREEEERRKT